MELLLNYLLKSGLCLLVLYLFYYALLRKQPNFAFNRLYLLLAIPVAFGIPFLKWPASLATETTVAQGLKAIQLPEITISAAGKGVSEAEPLFSNISFMHVLLGVYLIGACIFIFKLFRQLAGIHNLAASATPSPLQEEGITVLETPEHSPTFAFLSYVFISRQNHLSDIEKKQVLDHEMAHVQLRHTLDILYFEILTALFWFHPVVWLLKNELRDVHEYQADARALTKHQITHYSSLLSKEALYRSGIPVGSYFKEPQIFKRLQMLHNYGKRSSWIRPALLFPLLGGLTFVFSSQQINAGITAAVAPALTLEQHNSAMPDLLQSGSELKTDDALPTTETDLVAVQEKTTTKSEALKAHLQDEKIDPKAKGSETEAPVKATVEEKPFTYVEQMPAFKGDELELQKFLARNIRYPQKAAQQGEEGIVFLSFTVSREGIPTNYEIVKGVSDEINAEAIRVFKLTENNWTPGKQNGRTVPVKFTIPIRFSLD